MANFRSLIAASAAVLLGFAAVAAEGDPLVVTNTGMFEVSSPTTFSYVTNFWYNYNGYGLVSADVTVDGNSYLRIGKTMSTSDPEHGTYFATNANDDVTFTVGGGAGAWFTYRNSQSPTVWKNTGIDPNNKTGQPSYSHLRAGVKDGEKDASGRMKFVVNSNPNSNFGDNIKGIALWASYLHIESSLKAHETGYIDILELNNANTVADVHYFCNHNPHHPTRILFNGGRLRNNQACVYQSYGKSQFLPDANTTIVLEGVNGNDITINKCFFSFSSESTGRRLNGGAGTLRFVGNGNVRLADDGANNPGTSQPNRGPFILDPAFGPIEWKQKGELVLFSNGWLMMMGDNMLPCNDDAQTIRLQGSAALDLNGYKLALRSLISDASATAYVTNLAANYLKKSVESLLVFGTNDMNGVFAANTCDHISVEKVGTGTLVVSNVTMDVGNTGTGEFVAREGTVVLVGANKIGNANFYESAKLAISNEATVIRELVVNVASGKTTEDGTLYADYENGVKLRLRKTGAGTLVLKNLQNSFTGGIVIDGGKVLNEAIWNGNGADTKLETAANWANTTAPTFDYNLKMVMSSAGSTAMVTGETKANELVITNAAESGGPTDAFVLQGSTSDPKDSVLKLSGKASVGDANVRTLTLKNITIEGENGVDETTPAFGGDTTMSLFVTNSTTSGKFTLNLSNAIISKPVAFFPRSQATILTMANTTNEFKAQVKRIGGGNWFTTQVSKDSKLILSGGVVPVKGTLNAYGDLLITNKPWRSSSDSDGICSVEGRNGSHVRFAVASNYFGKGDSNQNGLRPSAGDDKGMFVDFDVSDAIYDSRLNFTLAAKSAYNKRSITVDFHCTTQRIIGTYSTNADIDNGSGTYKLTGEPGSLLIIDNKIDTKDSYSSTNVFLVAGGLGIEKRGAGLLKMSKLEKVARNDATTTGPLTVTAGTVEMEAGCSWRNGPVSVSGGALKFSENDQLGRKQSLSLSDDGTIDIPKDVTIIVAEATLDGTPVEAGEYTKGDEGIRAHITGEGKLKITPVGTCFIVK